MSPASRSIALFSRGGLLLGRLAGADVRLHWSAPIGAFVFNGFRFDLTRFLCFTGLILIHEVGHALAARACGARPTLLQLTAWGGSCAWRGEVSRTQRAAIAWGGVWAQSVVLVLAMASETFGQPSTGNLGELVWSATYTNAWLIAVNLIPIEPLDGRQAWPLPFLLGRLLRRRLSAARVSSSANAHVEAVDERDTAFDAGGGGDDVKALASSLLDEARKGSP